MIPPCTADPDLFAPDGWGGYHADQIESAKAVCATCPVRDACLDTAMREEAGHVVRWTIRGGLTGPERLALTGITAPSADARCGSPAGYSAHRRRGEAVCAECRVANAEHVAGWRGR